MEFPKQNLVKLPQPSLPFKTRLLLALLYTLLIPLTRRRNGTVNRRIFKIFDFKAPATPKPINHVKSHDIIIDSSRDLWIRVFTPTLHSQYKLPVIVYFHGGGFVYFSPATKTYDTLCRRIAREVEAVVVSVNYRLSPEHRVPAAYDDGFDVLKFLDDEKNVGVLPENVDLSRCFVAGDSAGGNLGHHATTRACEFTFRELKVIGLIALQPFFGGKERTESEKKLVFSNLLSLTETDYYWAAFLPAKESNRDHWAVNVSSPNALDISNLEFPPTIIFMGGFDLLKDWQMKYYNWLISCGKTVQKIEYPNMIHSFYAFPEIRESAMAIAEIRDFVCNQG